MRRRASGPTPKLRCRTEWSSGTSMDPRWRPTGRRRTGGGGRGEDGNRITEENSLWIQPKVTVDDITEFWYANRRMKEERTEDT